MEPWGTLDITESRGEETPFNNTSWQRLDRQLEIQQMNKWDWNLEAKKSVQESLVQDTVESLSKLEKHTGSTLAIFQNLMPLMYSQEEGGSQQIGYLKIQTDHWTTCSQKAGIPTEAF